MEEIERKGPVMNEGRARWKIAPSTQRQLKLGIRFYWGLALFIGGCAVVIVTALVEKIF